MFIGNTVKQVNCAHDYKAYSTKNGVRTAQCALCKLYGDDLEVDQTLEMLMKVMKHEQGRMIFATALSLIAEHVLEEEEEA